MATELTLGGSGEATTAAPERRVASPARLAWRALWKRKLARIAIIYITIFYLVGIFAGVLAPSSYKQQNLDNALAKPSLSHPFGTDRLGRDQLSRMIYAMRTTVVITVITVLAGSLLIGPALGLLAGYRGGWVDSLISRVGEAIAGLPSLLIIILLWATFQQRLNNWVANYYGLPGLGPLLKEGYASLFVLFVVLTLTGWVGEMRLVRALTLSLRNADYVQAAQSAGAGTWRILGRHILPNLSYILILGVASAFGTVALSEIGLSFLGLGVKPPTPSFGTMIVETAGRTFHTYPWLFLPPAFVASGLLVAFALLGDALNDVLNPRTRDFT